MAITTINWDNKSDINTTATPRSNKVVADDMNEIKSVVNTNATLMGNLANLNTTDKTSVVNAINEVITNSEPVTLWTNPSPNNKFGSQSIALSSSDYSYLEIYYYEWGFDSVAWKDVKCVKTLKGYNTVLETLIFYNSKAYVGTRRIRYVNDTSLQVDNCYSLINENTFSNITSNVWCIPIKILGYK